MVIASRKQQRRGISLIELLVVLAVIAVLLGLMMTSVSRVRMVAARSVCQNNFRQICLATINCADTNGGNVPPLAGTYPASSKSDGTVFFHILPYLEQDNLYKATADGKGNYSVWNANTFGKRIKMYICPDDVSAPENGLYKGWLATSSYAANFQALGDRTNNTPQGRGRYPASFPDGTSNTILFSERFQVCNGTPCAWGYAGDYDWLPAFARSSEGKFQTRPTQGECNSALAQSMHPAGINVGMADASSRTVTASISPQTWWHACTPDGGEVLGNDW